MKNFNEDFLYRFSDTYGEGVLDAGACVSVTSLIQGMKHRKNSTGVVLLQYAGSHLSQVEAVFNRPRLLAGGFKEDKRAYIKI